MSAELAVQPLERPAHRTASAQTGALGDTAVCSTLRSKPVKIVKHNEGHGFRNEENQYEFYGAMETFLAKHLKPQQPPRD